MSFQDLCELIIALVGRARPETVGKIRASENFSALGLNSIASVALARDLGQELGRRLSPTVAWEFPTIEALAAHLSGGAPRKADSSPSIPRHDEPIAIVGMGCRFPGASCLDSYFDLLCRGENPIREIPPERWNWRDYYSAEASEPGKTLGRWGGFLDRLEWFDAGFFRMSPREAAQLDPRQRLILETAWEAVEDSGQDPLGLAGSDVAVFVSTLSSNYGSLIFDRHLEIVDAYSGTGNGNSVIANRLSYFLDLRGPSIALDTACSGSLVAVHLAVDSLRRGDCPLALAGGVNVILKPDESVFFSKAGALSPDGLCRVFDARANGIVRSEGGGVLVLKRLVDALDAGDRVYAVIRAAVVNQDGASNGIMAPNGQAQERLLRTAYAKAGVSPAEVQYIEAHGTGTSLGDPIEVKALITVLSEGREPNHPFAIGSVKSNIGHTEAAAGMAGIIKTALSIYRRKLPGNLHCETPNPLIPFHEAPVRLQLKTGDWPDSTRRLIAGVSAFGFAGTNAHVVLEEAPARTAMLASLESAPLLLTFSAQNPAALIALAKAYSERLRDSTDTASVCHTAAVGRSHFEHRAAVTSPGREQLISALKAMASNGIHALPADARMGMHRGKSPRVAFLFSGQGTHWIGMGRTLFNRFRAFREVIDAIDPQMLRLRGESLVSQLESAQSPDWVERSEISQPAIFAVQAALSQLWRSFGVQPEWVLGQSLGEVTAAWTAGALTLEDAVRVVEVRSRLMKQVEGSGMAVSVGLSESALRERLGLEALGVWIAGTLSPKLTLLSGESKSVRPIVAELEASGVFCRPLPNVRVAFHSPALAALCPPMLEELGSIDPRAPQVRFLSSVLPLEENPPLLDASYWCRNLCEPFQMVSALERLLAMGCTHILEVSPHPALASSVREIVGTRKNPCVYLTSLRRDGNEWGCLATSLAQLYLDGAAIDWSHVYGGRGFALNLPKYPWQPERFWYDQLIEGNGSGARLSGRLGTELGRIDHPLLGTPMALAETMHGQVWQSRISVDRLPLFRGHSVQGVPVLPGAAYLEFAAATATALQLEGKVLKVTALRFDSALTLDRERVVQTVVEAEDQGARFRVFSLREDGRWQQHAHGEFAVTHQTLARDVDRGDRADFSSGMLVGVDDLYAFLAGKGLQYDGAFRALNSIYRIGEDVTAEIVVTDGKDPWRCHPAALDACLQLAAATRKEDDNEMRLPTGIESFELDGSVPGRFWCRARARAATETNLNLTVDLTLMHEDGTVFGRLQGITFAAPKRRDSRIPQDVRRWLFELSWIRATDAREAAQLPEPRRASERFESLRAKLHDELELDHYAGQWVEFDRLVVLLILKALARLGVPLVPGSSLESFKADAARLVASRHRKYWDRLLSILEDDGLIEDGTIHARSFDENPDDVAGKIRTRFPRAVAELGLVERMGARLSDILENKVDALELLFRGDEDQGLLERLYRDSTFIRFYNRAITEAIAEAVAALPTDRPVRLLEIGAGTGSATHSILAGLGDRACEYTFTDLSEAFLDHARRQFKDASGMVFRILDIEKSPSVQGFAGERFDLIIAANVLHATADLRNTLQQVRSVCARGAWLILLEGRGRQRWLDIIVGGTEGWWRSADSIRMGYPLLDPPGWMQILTTAGFELPIAIEDSTPRPPQFTLICRAAPETDSAAAFRWLLVGDGMAALAIEIRARGGKAILCRRAPEAARHLQSAKESTQPWRVICRPLAGLGTDGGDGWLGIESIEQELMDLIRLLQAIVAAGSPTRLWLITRNAQSVNQRNPPDPLQGSFWGLGRVIASEHPELWGGLVDLDSESDALEERRLLEEILLPSPEDQVAYRNGRRFVGRLTETGMRPLPVNGVGFRRDGAYLITGGIRGIGLKVAEWMADRGARRLIIVSRTRLPSRAQWSGSSQPEVRSIQKLEAAGVEVLVETLDVGDRGTLENFVKRYRDEGRPPIRGVIHAAGVIEDHLLLHMTPEAIGTVCRPKIHGAWGLHSVFAAQDLDFFVLFSSGTSLLGTFGQGNYAAANAFMDALAHFRRAMGLPAVSINWGVWGEVGIVARMERTDHLAENGLLEIPPREGLLALEHILQGSSPQIAAMPTQWAQWGAAFPGATQKALLRTLLVAKQGDPQKTAATTHTSLQSQLRSAGTAELRRQIIDQFVRTLVAHVMREPEERLNIGRPLVSLGLDSIMAVEIRSRVEREIQVNISIAELLGGMNGSELADRIASSVGSQGMMPTVNPAPFPEASPVISRVLSRTGWLPCSPAQELLWYFEAANSSRSPVYNIPVAVLLRERMDPGHLRSALTDLARKFEPLRTSFLEVENRPRQRVSETAPVEFRFEDLKDLATADQDASAERLATEFARLPFDLDRAPLARFLLILKEHSSVLVLSIHHLIFDGWSAGILMRNLSERYEVHRRNEVTPLVELPLDYVDYAAWICSQNDSPETARQLAYWEKEFGSGWEPVELPIDFARPASPTFRGAKIRFAFTKREAEQLRQFAQQNGSTLFMVFTSALGLLLHFESGQTQFVIATTPSDREPAQLENLVGYFVNTLLLRVSVEAEEDFGALLRRVADTTLKAFAASTVPFSRVVKAIRTKAGKERTSVQVVITLQNSPLDQIPIVAEHSIIDNGTAKFDLVLNLFDRGAEIDGWWEYSTDLFRPETAERLSDRFVRLMRVIAESGGQPLRALEATLAETANCHDGPARSTTLVTDPAVSHS